MIVGVAASTLRRGSSKTAAAGRSNCHPDRHVRNEPSRDKFYSDKSAKAAKFYFYMEYSSIVFKKWPSSLLRNCFRSTPFYTF
jgi:hypothetical protein